MNIILYPLDSAPAVQSIGQPADKSDAHIPTVIKYLSTLSPAEIMKVGTKLGLDYAHLKRMKQESLPEEMVHAWLRRDDHVRETTWNSLIRALESLGHNSIAFNIRKGNYIPYC